jgi:hypothetical protein
MNFLCIESSSLLRIVYNGKNLRDSAGESTECARISMLETRNTDAHKEECLRKVIALLARV